MRTNKQKVVFLAVCAGKTAQPQSAADQLKQLVEISAQRLVIAEQVALAKWDSETPVEDVPREAQVIESATKAGALRGLDQTATSNFFRAQIEANKLVQYAPLAEWCRVGKTPDHTPVSLANTIRPKLDQVQTALIAELVETAHIRASASCHVDTAKAVGQYVSTHKNKVTPLRAIALDRAMAGACTY